MLKFVWVAVQQTVKICIVNHGEQQTFRDGNEDGSSIDRDFDPAANMNVLSVTLVRL